MSIASLYSSIIDGKYVQIVDVNGVVNSISSGNPKTISFDASVCEKVPTWNPSIRTDIKGEIILTVFPAGYLPDLVIDDTVYKPVTLYNHVPQKMLVVADSKQLYDSWCWYQHHCNDKDPSPMNREVYKWNIDYDSWFEDSTYRDTEISTIVGLNEVFENIVADVSMLKEKSELLKSLGMNSSLNYLIQSKPGMGKTSLIRAIATHLNLNIHVITHEVLACDSLAVESLLSRKGDNLEMSIFVFEDFDRYLASSKMDKMASFLNALDGVADTLTSLRFFTCNSKIEGEEMDAFLSRMRRSISIGVHDPHAYMRSISLVFPSMPQEDVQVLVELFAEKQTTMRRVNNLLCASLVYEDPIAYIRGQI